MRASRPANATGQKTTAVSTNVATTIRATVVGAAAHEVCRALPRGIDELPLEHDQRREQAPAGGDDHARDDEQDQAHDDAEAVQDRGAEERPEPPPGRADECRDPLRSPALVDVADDVDERALDDDRAGERQHERQEPEDDPCRSRLGRFASSATASTAA